jgi:uncharacterized protein involved in exopolysaccharide biosynthesis
MTEDTPAVGDVSIFVLGTILLRQRWRIARWIVIGAMLGTLFVAFLPREYVSTASFAPRGTGQEGSGLGSLAGQFGVRLETSNQALSPEFYARLLTSHLLLMPIARDTFIVPEFGLRGVALVDLLTKQAEPSPERMEEGAALLKGMVSTTVINTEGVVNVAVRTPWPSLSHAIASRLLGAADSYKGQSVEERVFLEGRLEKATDALRAAEKQLAQFLSANRSLGNSPELIIEHDRIQRKLDLQQSLYVSLIQAYEEARLREIRDTPVITIFEPPLYPDGPDARGLWKYVLMGSLVGGILSVLTVLGSAAASRMRSDEGAEAQEFFATLDDVRVPLLKPSRPQGAEHIGDSGP